MKVKSLEWIKGENGYLKLLDQTLLPHKVRYIICKNTDIVYRAIQALAVRGAPAIGVAAGYGLYLGARCIKAKTPGEFLKRLEIIAQKLISARPTAVNLAWAVNRISSSVHKLNSSSVSEIKKQILLEAKAIHREDIVTCDKIGKSGSGLIRNGMGVLTYCNAGLLATAGSGTALAVFYQAKKEGRKFKVYVPETRPLLQGARLTAWELKQNKLDVILLCDNMIGKLMSERKIKLVVTGADRITANGDTANKIGTYQVALMAHHHRIPFYVAAPLSTFDFKLRTGKEIPIEFRPETEVTCIAGKPVAAKGVPAYNPAFDVTPSEFIKGFITEKGIITPSHLYKEIVHV
ncbi:MAG: S-methyl-5-thioribose-1-phosphate isomerase [Planctomycetes bacterium]|nr:S-methyl-5-thioribose-1-phosphate isomerase [Planctomycetota bacterium]